MVRAWLPLAGVLLLVATLFWRAWWQRHRYGGRSVLLFRSGRWQETLRETLGIALLVAAQLNLGASWRIGIEEDSRPGLVTGGLYRFCRNPIFFALLVFLAGYALLLPTMLSLVLLIAAFIGIRQQVLAEEAYLAGAYGDAYRAYAAQVGRFVPRIGRLG